MSFSSSESVRPKRSRARRNFLLANLDVGLKEATGGGKGGFPTPVRRRGRLVEYELVSLPPLAGLVSRFPLPPEWSALPVDVVRKS